MALECGKTSASRTSRFATGVTIPGTHCIGGRVVSSSRQEEVQQRKSCLHRKSISDSQVVQPVA